MSDLSQASLAELKASNEPDDLVKLNDARIQSGVHEMSEWAYEARRAWEYYASKQWSDLSESERQRTIPIVANLIRRDLDQMTARVLDAEPVVNPRGRYSKYSELGHLLVDLLGWTRDEESNWYNDLEDVIQDMFHGGEGIMGEGWNQSAANGQGMPESYWQDGRFICWDPQAKDWQRKDGEWVATFNPRKVDYLKDKYKLDSVDADYPTLHINEQEREWMNDYRARQGGGEDTLDFDSLDARAYEKIIYSKRIRFEDRYIDPETLSLAVDGKGIQIGAEGSKKPSATKLAGMEKTQIEVVELWKTVIINKEVVHHELDRADESKGGHGQFPFCWFTYVRMRDRSHGMGEINYLIGMQDLINRALSRWLEQLMIAGSSYIHSIRGSMAPEDVEKIANVANVPMQHIQTYAGFQAPEITGGDPKGAGLFAQGYDLLTQVKDSISGVYDVQRGSAPYQTSGRGIRALQSSTDLLGVLPRRHVESGLRQSTVLRIHNIKQNMRGDRLAEVSDKGLDDTVPLYIGNTMSEIRDANNLIVFTDKQTGRPAVGPEGEPLILADPETKEPVKAIALGAEDMEGLDFSRVTFELDSGKERNKEERMEAAREMLNVVGKGAVRWAVGQLDLPEGDVLLADMEKYDASDQVLATAEELSKATGIDVTEIIQMATQQVEEAIKAEQQQGQFGAAETAAQGGPTAPPAPDGSAQQQQGEQGAEGGGKIPKTQEQIDSAADVAADTQ